MRLTRTTLTVAAAAATVALSGCGGGAPSVPPAATPPATTADASGQVSAEHNQSDIAFVQGMIPHHEQAIDMAQVATDKATSPKVKELANKVEQAQEPEIAQLRDMLSAWGAQESGAPMSGMQHGGSGSMPGMMSDQALDEFKKSSGAAFDRMFLTMMIEHHKGAIQMAQTEVTDGQNAQAKELAQKIIKDQQAEISTMEGLLRAG